MKRPTKAKGDEKERHGRRFFVSAWGEGEVDIVRGRLCGELGFSWNEPQPGEVKNIQNCEAWRTTSPATLFHFWTNVHPQ